MEAVAQDRRHLEAVGSVSAFRFGTESGRGVPDRSEGLERVGPARVVGSLSESIERDDRSKPLARRKRVHDASTIVRQLSPLGPLLATARGRAARSVFIARVATRCVVHRQTATGKGH